MHEHVEKSPFIGPVHASYGAMSPRRVSPGLDSSGFFSWEGALGIVIFLKLAGDTQQSNL